MECYLGYALASLAQPQNQLEDRRSENNKMSKRVWKTVEASARKIAVGKIKERRSKRRKKVAEEWEIWNEEEEVAKLEEEAKKLVPK